MKFHFHPHFFSRPWEKLSGCLFSQELHQFPGKPSQKSYHQTHLARSRLIDNCNFLIPSRSKVTLHGMWASPYSKRVELALKVKGIAYEYVEEDLMNKSPSLLKYNPVHKMVPVLVHNEKPISESLIILEYIDEKWKDDPYLLPKDPYERAKVRFWTSFLHHQLSDAMFCVVKSDGEDRERAITKVLEKLKVLEEGIGDCFPDHSPLVNGGNMGILDIIMCSIFSSYKVQEELLGFKSVDPARYPIISYWVMALTELPVVKEVLPPHKEMVAALKFIRNNALRPPTD